MSFDTVGGIPPSPGRMNVDFEERVDFTRLRAYRLARAREALDASELGAVLLFDINNIRYVSATMIGEWARDKVARYALLIAGRRADRVGFRFRGPAPPAACAMAPAREQPPWHARATRGGRTRRRSHHARGGGDPVRARRCGCGRDAARCRHRGDTDVPRTGQSRHRGARRAADDARRAAHQVGGRDRAAVHRRGDGRRRLPGHRRGAQAGYPRERDRGPRQQASVRDGFR